MEWLVISIVIVLSLLVFVVFNLLRKTERLDEELTDVSLTLADVLTTIEQTYRDMKTIDSKGSFQSDDEIGHVFTGLKQEIDMLREKYIGEENNDK